MKVTVTKEHFKKARATVKTGSATYCSDCVLGLALSEAFGERVVVGLGSFWFEKNDIPMENRKYGALPPTAIEIRQGFDYDDDEKTLSRLPVTFEVEQPR